MSVGIFPRRGKDIGPQELYQTAERTKQVEWLCKLIPSQNLGHGGVSFRVQMKQSSCALPIRLHSQCKEQIYICS